MTNYISHLPHDLFLHLAQSLLDDRSATALAASDRANNMSLTSAYRRKSAAKYFLFYDDVKTQHTLHVCDDMYLWRNRFRLSSSTIAAMKINPDMSTHYDIFIEKHRDEAEDKIIDVAAFRNQKNYSTVQYPSLRIIRPTQLEIQMMVSIKHSQREERFVMRNEEEEENEQEQEETKGEEKEEQKQEKEVPKVDGEIRRDDGGTASPHGMSLPSSLESLHILEYLTILPLLPPESAFAHLLRLHTIEFTEQRIFDLITQQSIVYPPSLRTFRHRTPFWLMAYNETIIPSQINCTFPDTLTDLTIGRQYFQEDKFLQEPNLISLPSGLIIFHFEGMTTHVLHRWTNFPSTLTELRFGDYFHGDNILFEEWKIPEQLRILQFGRFLNVDITKLKLPEGFTSLILSSLYNCSLDGLQLPNSLRVFDFIFDDPISDDDGNQRQSFTSPLPDFSHTCLKQLKLQNNYAQWNQPIENLRLPKCIQTLILPQFNQPVDNFLKDHEVTSTSPAPPQLTHLEFGHTFNQPIDTLMNRLASFPHLTQLGLGGFLPAAADENPDLVFPLPPTLKHLYFLGPLGDRSLAKLQLPPGVETFELYNTEYQHDYPDLSHTRITHFRAHDQWNRPVNNLILPDTVTDLSFGSSFEQSVSDLVLPSSLCCISFGQSFTGRKGWFKSQLPSSLTQLELSKVFCVPLGDLSNTQLKSLQLPQKWNASITELKLPSTLESLQFGATFSQSISSSLILPSALTSLILGSKFIDTEFATIHLPKSLRILEFDGQHHVYIGALPSFAHLNQLESVTLPHKWNRSIDELNFYRLNEQTSNTSLTFLRFGDLFNQPIVDFQFPSSLRTLQFGAEFNQPIGDARLPSSITELQFGASFSQPLGKLVLPRQLRVLTLGRGYNASFDGVILPSQFYHFVVCQTHRSRTDTSRFTEFESLMSLTIPQSLGLLYVPGVAGNLLLESNDALRIKYEEWIAKLRERRIYVRHS